MSKGNRFKVGDKFYFKEPQVNTMWDNTIVRIKRINSNYKFPYVIEVVKENKILKLGRTGNISEYVLNKCKRYITITKKLEFWF